MDVTIAYLRRLYFFPFTTDVHPPLMSMSHVGNVLFLSVHHAAGTIYLRKTREENDTIYKDLDNWTMAVVQVRIKTQK